VTIGGVILAFVAGLLSVLSPCVLPILPVVLGTAASDHKLGPVALAGGLSISFVAIGLFVATAGYAIGLNADVFRNASAVLIVIMGAVLLSPSLQGRLALASGPIANWTDQRYGNRRGGGLSGQFWVGVLLGAVWSPCVGPTLGAASLLASQGHDLFQVGITMFAFGLGAAFPLLILGMISREAVLRWRGRILSTGQGMKVALGLLLIATGGLVLTGLDKFLETALVGASPQWLTDLTTRF
jgi:cytochrome c-type biogenesis protein